MDRLNLCSEVQRGKTTFLVGVSVLYIYAREDDFSKVKENFGNREIEIGVVQRSSEIQGKN
jgi:hypothetical protein